MALTLLAAIVSLAAWALLIFGGVTTSGVTHLLLAVGTVLLVRWWDSVLDAVAHCESLVGGSPHRLPAPLGGARRGHLDLVAQAHTR